MTDEDIARITAVTACAWEPSTASAYGSGLLVFHVLCDIKDVPEQDRAPASFPLIQLFVASLAGSYAPSAIKNYVYGVRAWHIIHGLAWQPDKLQLDAIVDGAGKLAPASSKRKPRDPFTVEILIQLAPHFDLSRPADAAIWACITFAFYSLARLGELTVKNEAAFNKVSHPSRSSLKLDRHRDGSAVKVIALPKTKVSASGEEISVGKQDGATDPWTAMDVHLALNPANGDAHIFGYRKGHRFVPLTRNACLRRIREAAKAAACPSLTGHSLRIGGTLEYLLRGISFEAVKAIGRWKSDSFQLYLRRHAQMLAPYLQANEEVYKMFSRLTIQIPPPR